MLILARKLGESIMIGDDVEVMVTSRGDQTVKLGIVAPRSIPVHRKEVYEAIHKCETCGGRGIDLPSKDGEPPVAMFFQCGTCHRFPVDSDEREYHRCCISSSGTLLEACKLALERLSMEGAEESTLGDRLRYAIAKIEGDGECPETDSFPFGSFSVSHDSAIRELCSGERDPIRRERSANTEV